MGGFCPIFSAHQETAPEHKACVCVCVLWEVETLSTDTTRQQKTASLTWTDELQSWTKTLVGAPTFTTCWRRRFGAKQEQNPHVTFFSFTLSFFELTSCLFFVCFFCLSQSLTTTLTPLFCWCFSLLSPCPPGLIQSLPRDMTGPVWAAVGVNRWGWTGSTRRRRRRRRRKRRREAGGDRYKCHEQK